MDDKQIEQAAKNCMHYVQESLMEVESIGGSLWPYIDGWNPFEEAIKKALHAHDSYSQEVTR